MTQRPRIHYTETQTAMVYRLPAVTCPNHLSRVHSAKCGYFFVNTSVIVGAYDGALPW